MMIHNQEILIIVAWNMIGSFVLSTPHPVWRAFIFISKLPFQLRHIYASLNWIQNFLWLKYSYLMPLEQLNPHQLVAVEPLTLLVLLQSKKLIGNKQNDYDSQSGNSDHCCMEYDRVFCTQYTPPCMKSVHFYFKFAFSITTYLRLIKLNQTSSDLNILTWCPWSNSTSWWRRWWCRCSRTRISWRRRHFWLRRSFKVKDNWK